MEFVGVTEQGDAGVNFAWVDRLQPKANITISKTMNWKLIDLLVKNQKRIIHHMTVTGMGGTRLEPNVPTYKTMVGWAHNLIDAGFPATHLVLRIDPSIPTPKGIETMENVLRAFQGIIGRVRYSFLDMYDHVKERFRKERIPLPYETFHAPRYMLDNAMKIIEKWEDKYSFESCAEINPKHKVGCVSEKDLQILGVDMTTMTGGFQRKLCACLGNKKEILCAGRHPCPNGCIYCFWKRPGE